MRSIFRPALAIFVTAILAVPGVALAEGPDVFKSQGCTKCHSVTGSGIARDAAHDEEAKDLSKIGARHDNKWIAQWLLKKVDVDGEKHKKTYQGSTDDLKTLATWLESLK